MAVVPWTQENFQKLVANRVHKTMDVYITAYGNSFTTTQTPSILTEKNIEIATNIETIMREQHDTNGVFNTVAEDIIRFDFSVTFITSYINLTVLQMGMGGTVTDTETDPFGRTCKKLTLDGTQPPYIYMAMVTKYLDTGKYITMVVPYGKSVDLTAINVPGDNYIELPITVKAFRDPNDIAGTTPSIYIED